MREKANEPMFAIENQITKIIIQAVKEGLLKPYKNDSLTQRMPYNTFLENLKLPGVGDEADDGFEDDGGGGGGWGDDGGGGGWGDDGGDGGWGSDTGESGDKKKDEVASAGEFFPKQITTLRIREDLIFDRKRSRMYHDIQSITMIIPAENFTTGLDREVATFSYKELVENVFLDNPNAVWYNPQNLSEKRNLSDAFDLRLFAGRIYKYSNPKDNLIEDIYPEPKQALGKSQQYEHDLLEYESNLWSN
jgi:hypothetical protein